MDMINEDAPIVEDTFGLGNSEINQNKNLTMKDDLDYGKSLELAGIINAMKPLILCMDLEYAKECARQIIDQGHWQDSAIVLNPSYDMNKSKLLRMQGDALNTLISYIEKLKGIDAMKVSISETDGKRADILKMFI